ncbi:MAG: DUF3857 and transglutaminase domain-containing protein [Saprospiraceae bacterium]|nr:DUF3857 and transglutaminase domain-containing protein [Saprospiraceae bacterium]
MKIKFIFFLPLMLFGIVGLAQAPKKLSFGKVPAEDLAMTIYSPDSSADAVVLDDHGVVYFTAKDQYYYVLERHRRIKILTEAGIDQGNLVIPFYTKDRSEKLMKVKAQVIQPDGSVVKVDKDYIVEEKQDDNYTLKKIAFPEVKIGSILEYEYTLESSLLLTPDEWYFQGELPVRYSQLEFNPMKELQYSYILTGNEKIRQYGDTYVGTELPAITKEPFMTRAKDYYTRLNLQLKGIIRSNGYLEPILNSWEKIAKELSDSDGFGNRFYNASQTSDTWKLIEKDVTALSSQNEKAKYIYDYVVSRVTWNDDYTLYPKKKGDQVLEEKLGSSAEINATIVNLMRKANLTAHPVITSPRSMGWFNPGFPILNNINNVIACVEIDGKRVYFNGANTNAPFGVLGRDDYNRSGVMIKNETAEIIEIAPQNMVTSHKFELKFDESGKVKGIVTSKFSQVGIDEEISKHKSGEQEKNWKERLSHLPELQVEDYTGNVTDKGLETSLNISYGEGEEDAEMIYFSTDFYSLFHKNPFKSAKRTFPIDFGNGYSETVLITLEIPEGYVLESLPQNLNISTGGKEVAFLMSCSQVGNKLSIMRRTSVNSSYLLPEHYESLKNIFAQIESKNADMLILKKS